MIARFFVCLILLLGSRANAALWAASKPKLVVVIVIDQFRGDYISRFESQFGKNGFRGLIDQGAYFPYGRYDILQSMTAPGHATILTGAYPYQMGIPLNDWFDQKSGAAVQSITDESAKLIGSSGEGVSPHHLIATTVGDELKNVDSPSKIVTLALKDRAAVLLGGHRPDLAFWFDRSTKTWLTSRYYRKDGKLPAWMGPLNEAPLTSSCKTDEACGIEMTVEAFKAALKGENLGRGTAPDLIAVSFSTHDFKGHQVGPNADEMKDLTLAEDKAIAEIRTAVQAQVTGGLKNVIFVLTGDHGVAPSPNYLKDSGIEAGYIAEAPLIKEMNDLITKKHGPAPKGKWVEYANDFNFFLNEKNVAIKKLSLAILEDEMKSVLKRDKRFAQVFTAAEVERGQGLPPGQFERQIKKTFYGGRSGHVVGIQKPFYVTAGKNTANHMTGYAYDRTVPIVLSGWGIKPGLYADEAEVIDIAPTLTFLLGVMPPALSEGRVLTRCLAPFPGH